MKKLKLLLLFISVLIISCNKDEYKIIDSDEAIPSSQALKNLYDSKTSSLTKVLTFDASSTLNYTSEKGVLLTINGNCLRKNGNPVIGQVKVKYIEIFDKGDMLTSNKPTIGKIGSNYDMLVSGGEFYIQATQDDINLTLTCPFSLNVPTSLTGGTDTSMLPFSGTTDANGELSWEQPSGYDMTVTSSTSPVYAALIPSFGWFNCDRFKGFTGPKTPITVNVPAGYGSNCSIFLALKSDPHSLSKTLYGQFPIGLDCYLIFVTEKNGKFRYVVKPQILTANHTVTFSLSETTIASPDELTAVINALP